MSLWSFRFLLFYICILFTQPQNRFTFLHPLHIADIAVLVSLGLHVMSAMQEKRPIIRFGPASIVALILLVSAFISLHTGVFQTHTGWNSHIDMLAKGCLLLVMVEAMAFSIERVWAVSATMMFATLWWIKGGLRLAISGATYSGARIMGPAVSIIENPNGFAYLMCVMIPLYLYFYERSREKYIRWAFLVITFLAVYIVLETGSRTGMLILLAISLFLLPRYAREHKATVALAVVAVFLVFSAVSPGNIRRLKTIPKSLAAAFSGEVKHREQLDQDEESAQTRQLKNKDTWALIKAHPVFGVGIDPNEQLFLDKYPNAGGQVHCEILMAGKQMGFIGMGLYLGLVGTLILRGRTIHRQLSERWPDMANLGWTLKMQGITILVGGAFSPLPWNPVLMLLAGSASALWGDLSANEEVPEIE